MLTNANLAPGNRVDYLVKAPMVTTQTCYTNFQSIVGNVNVGGRRQRAAPPPTPNALLTVCVDPSLGPKPMAFPTTWVSMPPFLADIPAPSIQKTVAFSMTGPDANTITGNPHNHFFIDGVQYCPHCANHTLTLNTAEEWTITNASSPQHPFHLHVNPHQLVETGFMIQRTPNGPYDAAVPVLAYTPPVWEDTIALIKQGNCWDLPSGPLSSHSDAQQKCPEVCASAHQGTQLTWKGNWVTTKNGEMSVCGCCAPTDSPGYTKIRVLPTDFTGETVLHCHILGHEDRGMMQNVQMVCPPPHQTFFGKPRAGHPECVQDNYLPAAKQCPASYPTGDKCAL
jgi:FtsP/CotA-like multicopper oxidase with cupredoxin domain